MKNSDIRIHARDRGVKLWEIADAIGVTDGNFSRKLRHELPDDEKQMILSIIDRIAKENERG